MKVIDVSNCSDEVIVYINNLQKYINEKEKEIQDLKQKNDYLNDLEASAIEYKELKFQLQQKENIIKEVREYITSYESISTIQGLENIKNNKDLDEKTLNEMVRRYMMVHDKILEILKGEDKE